MEILQKVQSSIKETKDFLKKINAFEYKGY